MTMLCGHGNTGGMFVQHKAAQAATRNVKDEMNEEVLVLGLCGCESVNRCGIDIDCSIITA
jgi:hypothetical protein